MRNEIYRIIPFRKIRIQKNQVRIIAVNIEEKTFLFKEPLRTASGEIRERKSFLITLEDENGIRSTGEAAPLDGFSRETFSELKNFLEHKIDFLLNRNFNTLCEFESFLASKIRNFPTLIFALESAFLKLAAKRGDDLPKIFYDIKRNPKESAKLQTAFLVSAEDDFLQRKISEAIEQDYNTIKIKITPKTDFTAFAFLNKLPRRVKFRFDANGGWEISEARSAIEILSRFNTEFIEDPTNNLSVNIELARNSERIAVDLSAKNIAEYKYALENGVKTIVLKPSFLGGLLDSAELILMAKKRKAKVVISSAFESVAGREVLYFIASLLPGVVHGLALPSPLADDSEKYEFAPPKLFFDYEKFANTE